MPNLVAVETVGEELVGVFEVFPLASPDRVDVAVLFLAEPRRWGYAHALLEHVLGSLFRRFDRDENNE